MVWESGVFLEDVAKTVAVVRAVHHCGVVDHASLERESVAEGSVDDAARNVPHPSPCTTRT